MKLFKRISAWGDGASKKDNLQKSPTSSSLNDFSPRDSVTDRLSTDDERSRGEVSSSFGSISPQSSATSSVPPRAEEWDRTLRHTGLEEFGKALASAARTIYPNSNHSRPKAACREREINELRKVLEDVYHYEIDEFRIPDCESHGAASEKINEFVKINNNSSSDLKIVYYAGHSRLSRTKELIWTTLLEKKITKAPTVMWSGIQRSLEMAQSDVLILLDCCFSGVANVSEGNGVTELICSCSFDTVANGVGHYSFTQALTTELRLLSTKPCFAVGELFTFIYTRFQSYLEQGIENERYPPPIHFTITQDEPFTRGIKLSAQHKPFSEKENIQKDLNKRVRFQNTGSLEEARENESSHVLNKHCRLDDTSISGIEEVILPWVASVESRKDTGDSTGTPGPSMEGSSCPKLEATQQGQRSTDEYRICTLKDSLYPLDAPRALFAVRFQEDIRVKDLSVELFKEWLRSIPAAVEEVCVEAAFKCYSTLVFITIPLSMASYIPQHPAIFPLGPVKSSNMLPSEREMNHSFQHEDGSSCTISKRAAGKRKAVHFTGHEDQFIAKEGAGYADDEFDDGIPLDAPARTNYIDDLAQHRPQSPPKSIQDIHDFEVSESAIIYVRNILDKFPSADIKLAERLGESNWQRHVRIRSRNEGSEIDREVSQQAAKSIFKPISTFHDSGLGSSMPATSSYAVSLSSFISKAGDAESQHFRVPEQPKEVCFLCGKWINHIKNRTSWKMHVFADIRPYICTFSSCKDSLGTFATRNDWIEHEVKYHLERTLWPCTKCPTTTKDANELRTHLYEAHFVATDQIMLKPNITIGGHLKCPLCRKELGDSKRVYASHVAKHMESIALAALPPDPDDVSDDELTGVEKAASHLTGRSSISDTTSSSSPLQKAERRDIDYFQLQKRDGPQEAGSSLDKDSEIAGHYNNDTSYTAIKGPSFNLHDTSEVISASEINNLPISIYSRRRPFKGQYNGKHITDGHEYRGFSKHRKDKGAQKYTTSSVWYCDRCPEWESSGAMSIETYRCTRCDHYRCSTCAVEAVKLPAYC